MSDELEDLGRRLLAGLPEGTPDPAYRARQKQAFASAAVPVARPVAARRPRSRGLMALVSAAAVLAIVGTLVVMNPGPRWQVARTQAASGNVLVDGEPIPADDTKSLGDALLPGARIEWNGDGDLELVSRGQLALGIAPGTTVTLPPPPPRWFARTARTRVETGTIRLASGAGFHGARVEITTPEARVIMTGTTLAVIREPMGTCVCVLEGAVHVMARSDTGSSHDMGMVPAGQRQVVLAGGAAGERATMRRTERVKLGAMKDKVKAELAR